MGSTSVHEFHEVPRERGPTWKRNRFSRAITFLGLLFLLTACSGPQSMLDAAGTGARETLSIWWLMFWLGTAVFVVVLALLWFAVTRATPPESDTTQTSTTRTRIVLLGGIVAPVIIVAIVFVFSTRGLVAIGDLRGNNDVTIDVVAHQFWWEVSYPDENFVTANEIHIPVDESVEIRLTSEDVIHSFWVPSLHGKIDVMPGHTTSITLRAEETGTFRGQCAQFCGAQHANMAFLVIVQEPDEFRAWAAHQSEPAVAVPEDPAIVRGQDIFMSSMCVYCHTVRGTAATGTLGPDLTHFGGRYTIGAGMMENNRGNLAGWIVDPQELKPGNHMPGITLTGEELDSLLDYLESLD